jgi:hypothetical protein
MVVISAALISKDGRILLARQFIEVSRHQIEGMLSNFTKLIGSEMQHTFVENEAVRYVYQPLESIYLVLVTSKNSNIVEDLETLRLLQKVVQHYCAFGVDEANILKYCFEMVWAFDDIVSLGYRESVTLGQVLTYTAMESAEERLYKEKLKVRL